MTDILQARPDRKATQRTGSPSRNVYAPPHVEPLGTVFTTVLGSSTSTGESGNPTNYGYTEAPSGPRPPQTRSSAQ